MDKQLFTEKIKPLGYLKRKWGGSIEGDQWEELVLKLFPKPPTCPNCTEVEFFWKRGKWTKKCMICLQKTVVSGVVTK